MAKKNGNKQQSEQGNQGGATAVAEVSTRKDETQTAVSAASAVAEVNEVLAANPPADAAQSQSQPVGLPEVRTASPNSFFITEDQLNTTHFKNPRGEVTDDAVAAMVKSLKAEGQGQEVQVGKRLEDGSYPVCAGWTRTEAFRRMVYRPLIDKFNKENNLKAGDTGFLVENNPNHRSIAGKVYPEDLAKNRDKYKIRIYVQNGVVTPAQAFKASVTENRIRTDMPLFYVLQSTDEMLNVHGMKAQDVGAIIGKAAPVISQYKLVYKLVDDLRVMLVTPEAGEQISESDLVKLREDAKLLCDELERRMKLEKGDAAAPSWSHLLNYTYAIRPEDNGELKPITRAQAMEMLCRMMGVDPGSRKIVADSEPENYTPWIARLKIMKDETKKRREVAAQTGTAGVAGDGLAGANPVANTVAVGPVAGSADAGNTEGGTVAGLADAQAAAVAGTPVPANVNAELAGAAQTGTAEAQALNAGATVAPAPDAATPAAPAVSTTDATTAKALGVTPEELAIASQTPDAADSTTPAGQKKAKTQVSSDSGIKVKSADLILKAAIEAGHMASQQPSEEQTLSAFGTAVAASVAAALYQVLGMDDKYIAWNEAAVNYSDEMEQYLEELETWGEGVYAKHKTSAPPRDLIRPAFSIEGLVDEDVLSVGGAMEPTAEDLNGLDEEILSDEELAALGEEGDVVGEVGGEGGEGEELEDLEEMERLTRQGGSEGGDPTA